jgi:hypothetical protein
MSGPIVRTGTTPKFWENWDKVFGDKKKGTASAKKKTASAGKSAVKAGAKKAAKRSTKK